MNAPPARADTVKLAHSTWVGYGPLYIARDKGIFKKHGVDVDLIVMEDPKERFPTLMADRIQMIASTVDTALLYLKKPTDFQYVVAIDDSNGGDGIVAIKDIKTIADLKGRKVAVNEGSVSEFYLNVLLGKAGLKESDLNTVNMTAADAGGAFVAKRVDAAVTWEPWLTKGKSTDFGHLLVDSSTTPGLITDVIIVKTAWASAHQKDVAAIVASWNEAVAYYRANPDESIAIMAKGRRRLAEGSEGVQGDAARHQVLRRRRQQGVLRHPGQAGPARHHRAGGDRHLVEPRQAAGQGDPGGPDQLQLHRRLMPSFLDAYTAPKKDIPRRAYLTVSTLVVAAILAVWCGLSYGGLVRGDFLPTPDEVVTAAINGIDDGSLLVNTGVSVTEIMSGFVIASIFAVPLGVLMGSFKIVEAALEPVTNFVRYLPVSALIPLLILWVGIDIEEKITVIFIGTFFQQLILIADVSRGVSQDLLDVSYTLGANRRTVVARVLIPATLPGVMDTLRVTLGWAWTYLVVAELVAANKGLGYFILNSMRGLFTDQIFLGIMVIGLLGLITDQLFKLLRNRLLPWAAA